MLDSLRYYCTAVSHPKVIQQITEELFKANASDQDLTRIKIKDFIRSRLIDLSPRSLLESLQTMRQEEEMACREWTSICNLLIGLVLFMEIVLGPPLKYDCWAGVSPGPYHLSIASVMLPSW